MIDYLTAIWALIISGLMILALLVPHIDDEFIDVEIEFNNMWLPWIVAASGFVLAASSLIEKVLA